VSVEMYFQLLNCNDKEHIGLHIGGNLEEKASLKELMKLVISI
jgi:hypothetical protein